MYNFESKRACTLWCLGRKKMYDLAPFGNEINILFGGVDDRETG